MIAQRALELSSQRRNSLELAARKTLAFPTPSSTVTIDQAKNREPHATAAKTETSTDYTYQIPRLFNPSRDGTFLTGEKNAINFSRSYDAASNS